ncbi:hypothetical protein UFOVP708_19 [uncultured Caudovirales phage]|uniref:Uncharacterized protein n=1 Tax=uncultured Caudovirales phage TaxID=2100421 RepID=A0A6J5NHF4_9CAUD|nr:hypothetical protein UFOVP708_19 [uncultured Caudovirales phage]
MVPAFEAAIGLPVPPGEPAEVPKRALEKVIKRIDEGKSEMRYKEEAAQVAALFAKRAIRPDEVAALRRSMFETVTKGLREVDQVVMGKKTWNPTQARLFALLVERVMPKLSSISIEDDTTRKMEDLSLEELEAIALGKKKAGAVDAVVKQAEVYDENAEKRERFETKRDVIAGLAYTDAVTEAEKRFIARQVSRPAEDIAEEHERRKGKIQPKPTPEQLANLRSKRSGCIRENWRQQGLSEEEIAVRWQERLDKIAATKAHAKQAKALKLAQSAGLSADAIQVSKDIRNFRNKTLKEFKVHGLKGVRSSTSLAKEAAARAEKAAKAKERAENPRIYGQKPIDGITPEQRKKLRLRELRELRPDLFQEKDKE